MTKLWKQGYRIQIPDKKKTWGGGSGELAQKISRWLNNIYSNVIPAVNVFVSYPLRVVLLANWYYHQACGWRALPTFLSANFIYCFGEINSILWSLWNPGHVRYFNSFFSKRHYCPCFMGQMEDDNWYTIGGLVSGRAFSSTVVNLSWIYSKFDPNFYLINTIDIYKYKTLFSKWSYTQNSNVKKKISIVLSVIFI